MSSVKRRAHCSSSVSPVSSIATRTSSLATDSGSQLWSAMRYSRERPAVRQSAATPSGPTSFSTKGISPFVKRQLRSPGMPCRLAAGAPPSLDVDDLLTHRPHDGQDLVLLALTDAVLGQRVHHVVHHRVELLLADVHGAVGVEHALAGVRLRAAGTRSEHLALQSVDLLRIAVDVSLPDQRVTRVVQPELVGDPRDALRSSQPLVQAFLSAHGRSCRCRSIKTACRRTWTCCSPGSPGYRA